MQITCYYVVMLSTCIHVIICFYTKVSIHTTWVISFLKTIKKPIKPIFKSDCQKENSTKNIKVMHKNNNVVFIHKAKVSRTFHNN